MKIKLNHQTRQDGRDICKKIYKILACEIGRVDKVGTTKKHNSDLFFSDLFQHEQYNVLFHIKVIIYIRSFSLLII